MLALQGAGTHSFRVSEKGLGGQPEQGPLCFGSS